MDSVAQPEHAERHGDQRQIDVSRARHQERHALMHVGGASQIFGGAALMFDKIGRHRALGMLAEIIRCAQRVVEAQPAIDGLRHSIGREQLERKRYAPAARAQTNSATSQYQLRICAPTTSSAMVPASATTAAKEMAWIAM